MTYELIFLPRIKEISVFLPRIKVLLPKTSAKVQSVVLDLKDEICV